MDQFFQSAWSQLGALGLLLVFAWMVLQRSWKREDKLGTAFDALTSSYQTTVGNNTLMMQSLKDQSSRQEHEFSTMVTEMRTRPCMHRRHDDPK